MTAAGIGSCFAAAIYEVGRPTRLSSDEAMELESQWQDFGELAANATSPLAHAPSMHQTVHVHYLGPAFLHGLSLCTCPCKPSATSQFLRTCVCLLLVQG